MPVDMIMEKPRLIARYFFSLSVLMLALSIIYFSYSLLTIVRSIPALREDIEAVAESLQPISVTVAGLAETIPVLVAESEAIREALPPVLSEVQALRTEVMPPLMTELAGYREMAPAVLSEVETLRTSLPPMMTQASSLVQDARVAGREASEGAVSGLFTGLVKMPMNMVTGASGAMIAGNQYLNIEDAERIQRKGFELLARGSEGESTDWKNAKTKMSGKITLLDSFTKNDQQCRRIRVKTLRRNKPVDEREISACLDGNNEWQVQGEKMVDLLKN